MDFTSSPRSTVQNIINHTPGKLTDWELFVKSENRRRANRVAAINPPIDDTDLIWKFSIDPGSHTVLQNLIEFSLKGKPIRNFSIDPALSIRTRLRTPFLQTPFPTLLLKVFALEILQKEGKVQNWISGHQAVYQSTAGCLDCVPQVGGFRRGKILYIKDSNLLGKHNWNCIIWGWGPKICAKFGFFFWHGAFVPSFCCPSPPLCFPLFLPSFLLKVQVYLENGPLFASTILVKIVTRMK